MTISTVDDIAVGLAVSQKIRVLKNITACKAMMRSKNMNVFPIIFYISLLFSNAYDNANSILRYFHSCT